MRTKTTTLIFLFLFALLELSVLHPKCFGSQNKKKDYRKKRFDKAQDLYKNKEYEEAAQLFNKIINKYPESGYIDDAMFGLGRTHIETKRYQEAIDIFTKLIENFPDSEFAGNAQYWLASSYFGKAEYNEAASGFRGFINRYPDNPFCAEAQFKLARSVFIKGDYEQAALEFSTVIEEYPNSDLVDDSLFGRGESTWNLVELDNWYLLQLAKGNEQNTALEKTINDFDRIISEFSKSEKVPDSLFFLGQLYNYRGHENDYDAAIRIYNRLITQFDNYDKIEEAKQGLKQARSAVNGLWANPNLEQDVNDLLVMLKEYKMKKRMDVVAEIYLNITEKYPTSRWAPKAHFELGIIFMEKEDYKNAIKEFETIPQNFSMSKEASEVFLNLVNCYSKLGDIKNAKYYFKLYKNKNPHLKKDLEQIYHFDTPPSSHKPVDRG